MQTIHVHQLNVYFVQTTVQPANDSDVSSQLQRLTCENFTVYLLKQNNGVGIFFFLYILLESLLVPINQIFLVHI